MIVFIVEFVSLYILATCVLVVSYTMNMPRNCLVNMVGDDNRYAVDLG